MHAMSLASCAVRRAEKPCRTVSYAYSILAAPPADTERSDLPYHSPWSANSAGIADLAMWTMYVARCSAAAAAITASARANARSILLCIAV
uniref:Uncharacterized protein n=1 Tax=Arundo donax TaxID=35708 RepID=A0A0A8YJM8_ARUDO